MTSPNHNLEEQLAELDALIHEGEVEAPAKKSFLDPITSKLKQKLSAVLDFKHLQFGEQQGLEVKLNDCEHSSPFIDFLNELDRIGAEIDHVEEVLLEAKPVQKMIHQACQKLRANAEFRQIQISYEIEDIHQEIWMDEHLIAKVLTCMIDNSVKNCDANSKIKISAYLDSDQTYIISVFDTGFGMSKKAVDMLKSNLSGANADEQERAITSLYRAHQIMQKHDGDLSIKSKQYENSEFKLHFKTA